MSEKTQVAMDGSPGRVIKGLRETVLCGKFGYTNPAPAWGVQLLDESCIDIKFQVGPIQDVGINGCSIEDVIDVLVARLEGFQKGPFKCRENALAITKMEEAKLWLLYRTQKRQTQGVEGRNLPHSE